MALRQLFRSPAARRQQALEATIADPIIDRLVGATDRRLAQVPGHREKLRAPVLAARERLGAMIAAIPGPIEVSPESWATTAGLKPLFARREDVARAWSANEGVRGYFERHPASDCLGMLGLRVTERKVLSMVQQGNMQVEVARATVSFAEPQVLAPAVDEVAVRNELTLRALEYLAMRAMEEVGAVRAQKRELEKERSLLQAQLQLARRQGRGLGAMASNAAVGEADPAQVERELASTVAALEQLASRNLLPELLEALLAALARPADHLAIEPCRITLDPMNFTVDPGPQAVTPTAAILTLAGRGPFAVLVGRFPRSALPAPGNRFAEAARYL
jgi:hypothetical protein